MSQDFTPINTLLKVSRIVGFAAAIIIIISQVVLLYAKPYSGPVMPIETFLQQVVILVMMAILATYGALKLNPIPLFVASLVSFSTYSEYSLTVLFVNEAIRLGSLLYMATALTILLQKKKIEAARIVGLSAAIMTIVFQIFLLYVKLYSDIDIVKGPYLEVAIMSTMAILAAWGSIKLKSIPLFIAFLVSFVHPVHFIVRLSFVSVVVRFVYTLYWVNSLCSLLYLVAGLIIFIQEKKIEAARIIGLLAAILTIVLYGVMLFANPYSASVPSEGTYRVDAQMGIMALLAVWGSLKLKPILLFIAFLGSLYPPVPLYLLGAPGILKLIGICHPLFLIAGIVMFIQRRKQKNS